MDYFNFCIFRKLFKKRFISKILYIFIICLILFTIYNKCFCAYTSYTVVDDIYNEMRMKEISYQNQFIFLLMFPYFGNTQSWVNILKPMCDDIRDNQYDVYIQSNKIDGRIRFYVCLYHYNEYVRSEEITEYSALSGTYDIQSLVYTNIKEYIIDFDNTNNVHTVTVNSGVTWHIRQAMANIKSDTFLEFFNMVYGYENRFFNSILDYLDDINEVNEDILSELQTLSTAINQISSNTSVNYSQSLGQINDKVDDILTDNDTLINQNSTMIQQQEDINNNIEETNNKLDDINNTLTDDTVTSTASDLPSTDVTDPSQNGIDNIFQSIYNAFCTGQAQDIVFPIPFTNKNITLNPYYIRDMLNNYGASWIYTLIQAFWGYLIGRYIVKDISKKITKIKGGNIENIENENIKEEML